MYRTILSILLLLFTVTVSAQDTKGTKNINTTVYIYGVSTSFNDSIAYMTDVIEVQNAYLMPKTKFLGGRKDYTSQLEQYFAGIGEANRCCCVLFATNKAKAEKTYVKLRSRMQKKNKLHIKQIPAAEFAFKAERPMQESVE